MAFRAVFEGGEVEGRMMMAAQVPETVWFAPLPQDTPPNLQTHDRWILVGAVGYAPDPAWPGQVEYRLDQARSDVDVEHGLPGEDWGTAVYVLAVA